MLRLSPFSLILGALAIVSLTTEILLGSSLVKTVTTPAIMLVIVALSELIRVLQERASRREFAHLSRLDEARSTQRKGEVVALSPGMSPSGDVLLKAAARLVVSESIITGESGAKEKRAGDIVYAHSRILAGSGEGEIVAVGAETAYGHLLPRSVAPHPAFDSGAGAIALVLLKFMLVLVPIVFVAVSFARGNLTAAFLFALSVAVGLVPEMLPLVANACLAKGASAMRKHEAIVRNLRAMQELGSVDVLCVDKTGTLTGGKPVLEYYLDILGRESKRTLELSKTALTGRVEEILPLCKFAEFNGEKLPLTDLKDVSSLVDDLTEDGIRVQAVARLEGDSAILVGFLGFFDAPKPSARAALENLAALNVKVKVLTGDNRQTAASICRRLGLSTGNLLTGEELDSLSPDELALRVETTQVFAELTPRRKVRVVAALKENGHTIGFVGDGLNDLPALLSASVAISVDSAAPEVKESAGVVLLRKDLGVLAEAIREGRRAFLNMAKYVRITSASNFGNISSIVVAGVFLPFFPMTAVQILALNLLYDLLCFILPWDNVDTERLARPLAWSGKALARFMLRFGPVSTLFDLVAFLFLFFVFCPAQCGGAYSSLDAEARLHFGALFQSGWFLVSLWSQILILHLLRTAKLSFVESVASRPVCLATALGLGVFSLLPFTPLGAFLGLAPLSAAFAAFLLVDVVLYMLVTSFVKARSLSLL